jgi:hypothetical protein
MEKANQKYCEALFDKVSQSVSVLRDDVFGEENNGKVSTYLLSLFFHPFSSGLAPLFKKKPKNSVPFWKRRQIRTR